MFGPILFDMHGTRSQTLIFQETEFIIDKYLPYVVSQMHGSFYSTNSNSNNCIIVLLNVGIFGSNEISLLK